MRPFRPVVGSITWRGSSQAILKRGKATLGLPEFVRQTSDVPPGSVDAGRQPALVSKPAVSPSSPTGRLPERIRLQTVVSHFLDIPVGDMTPDMFTEARDLLFQSCKTKKPDLATDLLKRLLDECKMNSSYYVLYKSVFNVILRAWGARGDVRKVEEVFSLMENTHEQYPSIVQSPDRYSYNALLGVWAASSLPGAHERVLHIRQQMEDSEDAKPDAYTYNIVMTSYANRASEYGAAKGAEDLLLKFSDRHVKGLLDNGPGTISFNIVIRAWSNSGDAKGAERALEIFNLMQKLHAEGHESVKPDNISLLAVMNAFAKKGDVQMAEKLFRRTKVDGDLTPCYHSLMMACANSGRPDAGESAERLLDEMTPNEMTHGLVLKAYAKAGRPDAAYLCEDFLGRMVEKYLKYETDVRPAKASFHIVLQAWLSYRDKIVAAERSLALLGDMRNLAKQWMLFTKPDDATYSYVIQMWARVDINKALELLNEAERWKESPDCATHNAILRAFSSKEEDREMQKALAFLNMMEEKKIATLNSYNTVLHGYASIPSPNSRRLALELLDRMERGMAAGIRRLRPNMQTYVCILKQLGVAPAADDVKMGADIFKRMQHLHNDPKFPCELNLVAHSSFLYLLSRARSKVGAEIALEIFDMMSSQNYPVRPDGQCMNYMIHANANAPHASYTTIAHERLVRLSRFYMQGKIVQCPNTSSFDVVLRALSRSRLEDRMERAIELINTAKDMHERGCGHMKGIDGLYRTFFHVIAGVYHVDNGAKAEQVLDGYPAADVFQWNIILRLWSRSIARDKAAQARRLLLRMQRREGCAPRPDAGSFSAVLNAVAHTEYTSLEDKLEGFSLMNDTFHELVMSDYVKPDQFSYASMIRCQRQLKEPTAARTAAIATLVESCKSEGMFGLFVVKELEMSVTPDELKDLLGDFAESFVANRDTSAFPKEWSRNLS